MIKNILIAIAIIGTICSVISTFQVSNYHDALAKTAFEKYQKQIVASRKPVVVHFSTQGCGPCAAFEPTWQAVMAHHQEQCSFETVTWEGPDPHKLIRYFSVESYPTVIYIDCNGNFKGRDVGAISRETFEKNVLALLVGDPLTCNAK